MQRTTKRMITGFAAAFAIIAVLVWQVGVTSIVTAVTGIPPVYLVGGILLCFLSLLLWGTAWWIVLRGVTSLSFFEGLYLFFTAQFANILTPFGQIGGEPAIAYVVSKHGNTDLSKCFGGVLVADILNAAVSFSLFFLGLALFIIFHSLNPYVPAVALGSILLAVLIAGFFVMLWREEQFVVRLVDVLGMKLLAVMDTLNLRQRMKREEERDALRENARVFHETFRNRFADKKILGTALPLLFLDKFAGITALYVFLIGMGYSHVAYTAVIFILQAAWIANYTPLPGGLGSVEVVLSLLLLMLAAVPIHSASAATFLFRLATFWVTVLIGGVAASQLSLTIAARENA